MTREELPEKTSKVLSDKKSGNTTGGTKVNFDGNDGFPAFVAQDEDSEYVERRSGGWSNGGAPEVERGGSVSTVDPDETVYLWKPGERQIGGTSSPGSLPIGITYDGTHIWQNDHDAAYFYQMDTDLNVVGGFAAPWNSSNPNNQDCTWDGRNLWVSVNGTSPGYIYELDRNGTKKSTHQYPVSSVGGLEYVPEKSSFFISQWNNDVVYEYDEGFNTQKGWFRLPESNLRGIEYDGEELWITTQGANKLLRINFDGGVTESYDTPTNQNPGATCWDGDSIIHADYGADYIYRLSGSYSYVGGVLK